MSQSPILHFQLHLKAQGKRPGTVDRYVSIVTRFLSEVDVPAEGVTSEHAYAFLDDRENALDLSSSW